MATASPVPIPQAAEFTIRPLQPTIGAEVSGLDLSQPLDEETRAALKTAILRYRVLFFRDQRLDNASQAAFARQFGPLYTHPTSIVTRDSKISPLHAITAAETAKYEAKRPEVRPGDGYHTDTSWRLVPTWGAVLRAVTIPESGGDTIWVDANLAYEALSDELKAKLEGRHVTHNFQHALTETGHHDYPVVAHRIVRRHPETGENILWVNFQQRPQILGLELSESNAILEEVLRQYKRPEHQVRFSWQPGSVAFWDNRAAVHYAVRNYGDFPRVMERVLIEDRALYSAL